jgi:hypothetical protein
MEPLIDGAAHNGAAHRDPSTDGAEGTLADRLAAETAEAEQRLIRLQEGALAFVRARPIPCVVGALALGFLVGKIAARI